MYVQHNIYAQLNEKRNCILIMNYIVCFSLSLDANDTRALADNSVSPPADYTVLSHH